MAIEAHIKNGGFPEDNPKLFRAQFGEASFLLGRMVSDARGGKNRLPFTVTEKLLSRLNLDTNQPDGLGIIERMFLTPEGDVKISVSAGREADRTVDLIEDLLTSLKKRTANPQQRDIAGDLVMVGMIQYAREGNICPYVSWMLANTPNEFLPMSVRLRFSLEFGRYMAKSLLFEKLRFIREK